MTPPLWPIEPLLDWARAEFESWGASPLGKPSIVQQSAWAAVLSWRTAGPSTEQTYYLKAASPGFAHEMRLIPWLAERAPQYVVAPAAIDGPEAFMIQPDAGPTMARAHQGAPDSPLATAAWRSAFLGYADLQFASTSADDELLSLGLTDLRPLAAAAYFEQIAQRDVPGLRPYVDRVHRAAERLAELTAETKTPMTVQHDDLQPSNVLADGRFIDFGDAHLAHPFASLLTILQDRPGRPGGAATHAGTRDAYLGRWAEILGVDLAPLSEQADLAMLLAPAGRLRSWLAVPGPRRTIQYALDGWVEQTGELDWSILPG